jgi:uncharacterized protein
MTASLYDISVPSYLQILGGLSGVLEKGAKHAAENDIDLVELMGSRLHPDMLPFCFQVVAAWHHGGAAIKGIEDGLFTPPPPHSGYSYADLQGLLATAIADLEGLDAGTVNAMSGKSLLFRLGDMELPFTAENFILSFSLPNLYFHTTTAYDMLRMNGTPLGKMDFLGAVRFGA